MHIGSLLALVLAANAAILPTPIAPRAPPSDCEPEDVGLDMTEFNDGPTVSGDAGIGAEFETISVQFEQDTCGLGDTFQAKRKTIQNRGGTNFLLSADTSQEMGEGKLSAEYVLDGKNIKVGDGSAAAAGEAVFDSFMGWKPWSETPPDQVIIEDYPQCPDPWRIHGLDENTNKASIYWVPQITACMPLELVYSLMKENIQDSPDQTTNRNILNGYLTPATNNLQLVTKEYFQSLSRMIDTSKLNDATYGFCSLILSYAKAAAKVKKNAEESSPKSATSFMPRTGFNTIYKFVKSSFRYDVDLYDIFNVLACYKTILYKGNLKVIIDDDYCTGTLDRPVVGEKFGSLQYTYRGNFPKEGAPQSIRIKQWIEGIDTGRVTPDLLTQFDQNFDGSIGGLGTSVERIYKKDYTAPLFEFRDLEPLSAPGFKDFMGKVDSAVQQLHAQSRRPPIRKVKARSQNETSSCSIADPMITSPPSIKCSVVGPSPDTGVDEGYCDCMVGNSKSLTLSIMSGATAETESCAYTQIPSHSASISTNTMTWTSNCKACTLVGGDGGGKETCTSVAACTTTSAPSPTIAAFVANVGTIDIGNAEDHGDGGKSLATEMFNKLSTMCNSTGCSADHQEMDNVEAVIAGEEGPLKPAMFIDDAMYQDVDSFKQMLAVGISSWTSALQNEGLKLRSNVSYEADADSTASGCGSGPIPTNRLRRKVRRDDGAVLWERDGLTEEMRALEERCLDNCDPPTVCHYDARMCQAPETITVVSGTTDNPYGNHLTIVLTLDKTGAGFDCEAIVGGLTALMAALAPEFVEGDALEGVELEALCGIVDDPTSAFNSTFSVPKDAVKISG